MFPRMDDLRKYGRMSNVKRLALIAFLVYIANGWEKPDGMCNSAWESMSAFVMTLAHGGEDFYDGWMKNKKSAMISCDDGFRPVSFLIEALDEDAE